MLYQQLPHYRPTARADEAAIDRPTAANTAHHRSSRIELHPKHNVWAEGVVVAQGAHAPSRGCLNHHRHSVYYTELDIGEHKHQSRRRFVLLERGGGGGD